VLCSSVNPVKIFLSHASEDQPDFVRPLAAALSALPDEFKVWYSEYELTLGDRLLAKIDAGLKTCDYGIVVLSPHFFAKRWPREELEGLFQLETTERKVILPIWKNVSESDVKTFSPILASRLGADAAAGIPQIVEEIRRAVGLIDRSKQLLSSTWKDKLKKLDEDVGHARRVTEFSATYDAVELVTKIAFEIIDDAWKAAEQLVTELSAMRLHLPPRKSERHYFTITGRKRLTLNLHFSNSFVNSIKGTRLRIGIFRAKDDWDENSKSQMIEKFELYPSFDKEMKVFWKNADLTFANGTAILDFAFDKFVTALSADQ
jgi:TIR domain